AAAILIRVTFLSSNDVAPSWMYALALHDALPISGARPGSPGPGGRVAGHHRGVPVRLRDDRHRSGLPGAGTARRTEPGRPLRCRSEEHTSELQSLRHLVCRLLLEKKK